MQHPGTVEKRTSDLSRGRRIFLMMPVSIGSSVIYAPAYLKNVFYDPLMEALHISNAQIGTLLSAYAVTATVCYLPSGFLADRVRVRTLSTVGFLATAALTFVYAMLPSYGVLLLVFVGMGLSTILIWWGVRYKLVRLISEEDQYAKNIGLSYGIYGAAGLVVGFLSLLIISALADRMQTAATVLIAFLGALILVLGILSYLYVPKFAGEIGGTGRTFSIAESTRALRNPVVWMATLTMFFVYFFYTGVNYTTPYLTDVFAAPLVVVTAVSIIRTYGVTLFSGPTFGLIADKVTSPSKVVTAASLIVAASLAALTLVPVTAAMVIVAAVIAIVLGFIANGVFGIVSSQLTEGRVPLEIFGAATGILSVVGFLPDTFSSTWFGGMIDASGNAAYPQIFLVLAGSAVLAALCALALLQYVGRHPATGGAKVPAGAL